MSNRELSGEFAVNVNDCELFYQKRATKHHNGRAHRANTAEGNTIYQSGTRAMLI